MRDKRVLIGQRNSDKTRVIIKASDSLGGRNEIKSEKLIQDTLLQASFSQEKIFFPEEIYYGEKGGYLIRITNFIEQEKVFGAYPLDEQFFMLMREFEAQESFYANTFEHLNIVKNVFPVTKARDYIQRFEGFKIGQHKEEALSLLEKHIDLIETRSNYLTHTDFAPSNFRVSGKKLYMIDLSSMHFGNRYEGLARFVNYCLIHNPKLGQLITDYIRDNRGDEESLCLRLMRIYKAGFLINHYETTLPKTEDALQTLTETRLKLWQTILERLLKDEPVDQGTIDAYRLTRDTLRSKAEVMRQKEFNLI